MDRKFFVFAGAAVLAATSALLPMARGAAPDVSRDDAALVALGADLFVDTDLSMNRTQACASCHMPDFAFTDPRATGDLGNTVSLGDDGASIGTRNAPTAAYAAFAPAFHETAEGKFVGGQFLDGRAATLADQAGGPPLNPVEMAMPDEAAVVARLREKADYVTRFEAIFGADILDDPARGYRAMTEAIAAFERTPEFSPFDSKYDRYLRGEVKLTDQEELGRVLFFSQQFTNCNLCHQLNAQAGTPEETFSNYEFHNIGVPANPALEAAHGKAIADHGLADNPAVEDKAAALGRFKVPSLRNVAVTGPYMHNGVFKDLRTVVLFYNKYNSKAPRRQIDPETGEAWGAPEVADNLSLKELETGPALDDKRVDALVAFMRTLTDARYESLMPPP
ncbi:methylamine utilization protein MauG [Zavarzinia compransoris]|uniref:cytochrome-c peroxidase n=1 Tax=Zavarzinia marina TaxID=2911065 RepID=UPI001F36D586|nr:cytochrome c peroxidase [Zavarzinia marina]MCF4164688.1 methylamine utilization protein MauG [Zavarzinia marina]